MRLAIISNIAALWRVAAPVLAALLLLVAAPASAQTCRGFAFGEMDRTLLYDASGTLLRSIVGAGFTTVQHLEALGLADGLLKRTLRAVERRRTAG